MIIVMVNGWRSIDMSVILTLVGILTVDSMMTIFLIFLLAPHICLIPSGFYKYLECRIQVDDHEEEEKGDNAKYCQKQKLESHNAKKRDNARSDEWEYEEEERDDDGS